MSKIDELRKKMDGIIDTMRTAKYPHQLAADLAQARLDLVRAELEELAGKANDDDAALGEEIDGLCPSEAINHVVLQLIARVWGKEDKA